MFCWSQDNFWLLGRERSFEISMTQIISMEILSYVQKSKGTAGALLKFSSQHFQLTDHRTNKQKPPPASNFVFSANNSESEARSLAIILSHTGHLFIPWS